MHKALQRCGAFFVGGDVKMIPLYSGVNINDSFKLLSNKSALSAIIFIPTKLDFFTLKRAINMNYDIRIVGDSEDNGLIEFDRLAMLTKTTKDIATKALMLRLTGYSDDKPNEHLKKALSIRLQGMSGNTNEGTLLTIDSTHFSETIKGLQVDIFKPNEEVLEMSPMALVMDSFKNALDHENLLVDLDKPLLKSLLSFQKNFLSENEIFYLANRGMIPDIRLVKEDFDTIKLKEDNIPQPRKVLVNGQLEELKISKGKLGLMSKDGMINLITNDKIIFERIMVFIGKEVTISGMAHYKSNGFLSYVQIGQFDNPSVSDKFFSKIPKAMNLKQQLQFQASKRKNVNIFDSLMGIVGIMDNELSEEQLNEIIRDFHR